MQIETRTMSLLLLVVVALMTSKKTKFGQMTLRATKALEYLKTSPEPIHKRVIRFTWIHKLVAEADNWELPEWVLKNDNYDWVCILDVADGIPFLVYQKSALRALETYLMKLEENGATVESKNRGKVLIVDLGDDAVEIGFWRNPNGGKFAPFNVELKS